LRARVLSLAVAGDQLGLWLEDGLGEVVVVDQ
jgi:hypothetical protein